MNIVIEGCDASGKSTLARYLSLKLGRPVVHSEGPEKYEGEMNERAASFLGKRDVIFDRHPCVGEYIYCILRDRQPKLDPQFTANFYAMKSLFIYCRAPDWFERHKIKEGESEQHIKSVRNNYTLILKRYDDWAKETALLWVLPQTNRDLVLAMLKGALRHA